MVLKWLRALECANKGNRQYAWRFFLLSNIIPFPLSMPLLVLRTTFPPKGGTKTLALFPLASRRPLWGEMPKAEGAALADAAL